MSHPSEALLTRFEHDRMTCEIVPTTHGRALPLSIRASLAVGLGLPLLAVPLGMAISSEAAFIFPMIAAGIVGWLPLVAVLTGRHAEVELTPTKVTVRWMIGQRTWSTRSLPLQAVRTVYVVPSSAQGVPPMLRIVADGGDVWLPTAGAPQESASWLADEIGRAAALARERDAAGPPPELEELLSDRTREVAARAHRLAKARSERAPG